VEALNQGADALFILLGGIMVLAMHAGFAFLELGTVRKKNQVTRVRHQTPYFAEFSACPSMKSMT
jgi:ammonia channel protein AmtB